jgi:hypothetical protein
MKYTSTKTKPGSPVLLSADEMRTLAKQIKPDDNTMLVRTRHTIHILPFFDIQEALGGDYLTQTRLLSGVEPQAWDGALIYYAGIEFDTRGKARIGKTNPIVFGALVALLPKQQLDKLLNSGSDSPSAGSDFKAK